MLGQRQLAATSAIVAIWFSAICLSASLIAAEPSRWNIVSTLGIHDLMVRNLLVGLPGWQSESLTRSSLGCLHDYTLKPSDLIKLNHAKLVIANGAGMETGNLHEAIQKLPSARRFEIAGAFLKKGGGKLDPHFSVDPFLVPVVLDSIAAALLAIAGSDEERTLILKHLEDYKKRLEPLRQRLTVLRLQSRNVPVVVVSENIRRLVESAGFSVEPISLDPEFRQPSSQAIAQLMLRIKSLGIPILFYDLGYDNRYIERIAQTTSIRKIGIDPLLRLDRLASLNFYETTMEKNLNTIESALKAVLPQFAQKEGRR